MTTPKSATEIMKEWDERVWATMAEGDAWLRAALASHTAYLLGKWPWKLSEKKIDYDFNIDAVEKAEYYNKGLDVPRAILEAEITELTK